MAPIKTEDLQPQRESSFHDRRRLSSAPLRTGAGPCSTVFRQRVCRFPPCNHTATLLNNGLVLIAGGTGTSGELVSAELYNPATQTFSNTGSMNTARGIDTATLLNNGMVLFAGGGTSYNWIASAELYNPATGTFSYTGNMNTARLYQSATLLNNGMVLVAGGQPAFAVDQASAELYNTATGTFSTPAA